MKLPKELEGRRLHLLLSGISSMELKISKITSDEIIGEYEDGEEIHVDPEGLRAYWISKDKKPRKVLTKEQKEKMQEGRRKKLAGEV